jgi:plastocyanin
MMRKKLMFGIAPLALVAVIIGGCSQSRTVSSGDNSANANSVQQPNGDSQTVAATSEIKRTELTQNADYAMELNIAPQAANAGEEIALNFSVKDKQERPFGKLKIVHEKPMHLLIVSDDLAFFDHVHPEQQSEGNFKINYKFPAGGIYKLYADFTPENSPQIVNVFDVGVGGSPREQTPLVADRELTKQVDGLTFTLKADQPLKAAKGAALNFYVTNAQGKPVTDLQPYLGAMAHFVVISQDATKFLHVHAEEGEMNKTKGTGGHGDRHGDMEMDVKPDADNAATPTVMAHTEFPTAGLYKLWGQFQHGGKIFTVPFVLNITPADVKTASVAEVPKDAIPITVSSAGFEPSSVSAPKGKTVKLAFTRKDGNNCASEVVFPKLKVKKQLPVGETVLVEVRAPGSGELSFACGMDMYKGKVVVQ